MTEREVRITLRDGVRLAATLYLPDPAGGPQPCLLEALPYRKDDLTASYADSYRRLRDRHGYAVCRLDLRGTGSSGGDATDEYPLTEVEDLAEVIGWLADQPWCDGKVGMWGTSYSGFNSLQVACARPPALKAVCAIYASDDRWTDDVHWRGGALRLVDLVDYCHYMTPMNALPPVPAVWGEGWREEWERRLATGEPWLLRWLEQSRDGAYWRHGSVRTDPAGGGYDRIRCAVMLVAGWADGYRNSTFRTVAALREAGVAHRLVAGPWAHASPESAIPGPRVDLEHEIVAWWDRWLRGREPEAAPDGPGGPNDTSGTVDLFVRSSTPPEPDLDLHRGTWVRDRWPSDRSSWLDLPLAGGRSLAVRPDVGTAAWIDCAGHLPWGLSTDQRYDDADSLTWELPDPGAAVIGHPRVTARVSASAPAASLSVKLCDVFPDGTSALVSRGTLDLAFRGGVHGPPEPLVPGAAYDVAVELDACAYRLDPGHRLRLSLAGADWPNTVAPPAPVTLTVHELALRLPCHDVDGLPSPRFEPGDATGGESADGVVWTVTRDVVRRTTTCAVASSSGYDVPYGGHAEEAYEGEVGVDLRSFDQTARARCTFAVEWPGTGVIRVTATLRVTVTRAGIGAEISLAAFSDGGAVARREWASTYPR